jgi:hypothetical protein
MRLGASSAPVDVKRTAVGVGGWNLSVQALMLLIIENTKSSSALFVTVIALIKTKKQVAV